jgi:hypothetical protein
VITTVPWAGSDAEPTSFVPPSTSVSFASTSSVVAAVSSVRVSVSSVATGESSTQLTVTDTVAVEPPFSVYVNVSAVPPGWLLQ